MDRRPLTTEADPPLDRSETADQRPSRSRVLVWVLGGLAVAALVIGVVVAALRTPETLDRQRPEGVVQAYLQAVFDRDWPAAYDHLSEETMERCPLSALRVAWVPDGFTAHLDDVRVTGDSAEVRVVLRETGPDVPGALFEAPPDFTESFALVREDGAWRLAGEPWPLEPCGGGP